MLTSGFIKIECKFETVVRETGLCATFWGCTTYDGVGTLVPVDADIDTEA